MFAYLSHYFFIILVVVFLIRPYNITYVPTIGILYLIVNIVVLGLYMLFDLLYSLCFPEKTPEEIEKEKKAEEEAKEADEKSLLNEEKDAAQPDEKSQT
jgi:hypothetical protein